MSITAIQGICRDGKIEPLEKVPYETDRKVIIVFFDDLEDRRWDDAVTADFIDGYSEKDAAYDKM